MINPSALITAESIGSTYLVDIQPAYLYRDNQRTDIVTGYFYIVLLPEHGHERAKVKIGGDKPLMQLPEHGLLPVQFTGLRARVYVRNNNAEVSFAADSIQPLEK